MDREHNYQKLLSAMVADNYIQFEAGKQYDMNWMHDDWCGINKQSRCDCNPDCIMNGKRLKIPWKYKRLIRDN